MGRGGRFGRLAVEGMDEVPGLGFGTGMGFLGGCENRSSWLKGDQGIIMSRIVPDGLSLLVV